LRFCKKMHQKLMYQSANNAPKPCGALERERGGQVEEEIFDEEV